MAQLATFKLPAIDNEANVRYRSAILRSPADSILITAAIIETL